MLVFEERGKPEFPEKNLSEQSREPTNSAHIWRRVRESNPGHIGGRRALSPLHQPCSPKIGRFTHANSIHNNCFKPFLSVHFSFWKFLNLNLTFAVCRLPFAVCRKRDAYINLSNWSQNAYPGCQRVSCAVSSFGQVLVILLWPKICQPFKRDKKGRSIHTWGGTFTKNVLSFPQ